MGRHSYKLKEEIKKLEMKELLSLCLANNVGAATMAMAIAFHSGDWRLPNCGRQESLLIYFDRKTNSRTIQHGILTLDRLGWLTSSGQKEKKEEQEVKTGIYGIFLGKKVYVGQSKDIAKRWETHRSKMRNGVHGYAPLNYRVDECEFKILTESKIEKLNIMEIVQANLLKAEGYEILNENNFPMA